MKKKSWGFGLLGSTLFLALSFVFTFYIHVDLGELRDFLFMFHLIPFGYGFSGGGNALFYVGYYGALWLALAIVLMGAYRLVAFVRTQ